MATATKELAHPKSRAAFVRLMHEHGTRKVTLSEAIVLMPRGMFIDWFWRRYFPTRQQLSLAELVPFVEYHAKYSEMVPFLAAQVLIRRGVLDPDYEVHYYVRRSTRPLPLRYQ